MYKMNNVSFKYNKSETLSLEHINLEIKQGEITGILGPSGAGKSTLQNILIKLITDYEGDIFYNNVNLRSIKNDYYNEIGVCFELPVMVESLTCIENLDFLSHFYHDVADYKQLLKEVSLWEDKDKLVGKFSKGMKTRLNFVRSLLNNPKVLFLDEPTSGLDPISSSKIKQMIKEYANKGNTVIITTHLMNDVEEICDFVAFIKDGRIVEVGTPTQLKDKYSKKTIEVCTDDLKREFMFENISNNAEFLEMLKDKNLVSVNTKTMDMNDIFKTIIGGKTYE